MADIEFKQGTNTDSAYVDGHKVRLIAIPSGTLELPISATRDSGYVVDGDGKKHKVILATFLTETPEYKDSPTADTAYVTVDGQKVKVTLTAELSSNLQLPESATADQGYAEDTDGNKHRVTLVATPTGTLQLPNSETDDTAYVIDGNGKKHKVRLFVSTTGPGYIEVVVRGTSPLSLPDAVADGLKYVKAYGDCENRNLPEGYQELEYIEGNNNEQYINTGIVPTSSMSIYFKGQFAQAVLDQAAFFLGARDESAAKGLLVQYTRNDTILTDFFETNGRWSVSSTRTAGNILEFSVANALAELKVNGTSLGTHQFTPDHTTQYPLFLNALNDHGSAFSSNTGVINRIYRFTIEGIADMRPARRLSDGVLGMYDTIRKSFFTNAGTGTFIAGNVVALPEGYTRLGFLQTTKTPAQCYFDTGKNFNSNYTYEVSFMKGGDANAVMGARVGAYNAKGNFAVTYVTQSAVYSSTSSASTAVNMGDTTLDVKHTVRYCQRDSLLTWDGEDKWKSDWINSESIPYNMYLFAMNQANTVQGSRSGYLRIYTYKVYDGNGILIQDLVPAVRNSDNAMGLYDTVADEFLLAKGSSVELTGSPVYTPTPTAPLDIWCNNGAIKAIRPIKYLECTGTQYIDTGLLPTLNTKLVVKATRIAVGGFAGSRDGADANSTMMAFATNGTSVIIDFNNGNNVPYRINYTIGTGIITIIAESSKDARRLYDANGTLLAENTTVCSDTFTATKNMTLFNCNGGSISGGCRIYYAQIWDGDTLVRDFIPALDMNNIPCMFDKVEGKCYYNAGTGQFIAGYLPAEYEELDYIQGASNVQYINTNIVPTYNSAIYAKAQLVTDEQSTNVFFFGSRTANTAGTGASAAWSPTALIYDWFGTSNSDRYSVNTTRTTGDILEWNIANSILTIKKNGTVVGSNTFSTSGTDTQPMYVNAMNNAGSLVSNNNAVIRFYRFTVAGVCDMIPARKRSNGHIGMYDLVRRQFFENAGEGQFTIGKLPILPETYTRLEYLESTGTQYIDTGVVPNQDTSVELDGSIDGYGIFFGVRTAAAEGVSTIQGLSSGTWAMGYNNSSVAFGTKDSNRHVWFKNKNLQYMDGVLKNNYTYANFTAMGNAYLFAYNNNGTVGYVINGRVRVYSCKIWATADSMLVRYLIPAKRNSDGVVGMYDIMNDVFLTNQGTGDFEYGAEIPDGRESYYYVDGDVETIATKAGGSTLSTATCENLLGIGSTQDVQEILTGEITRKVAVWVFNGTESWDYDSTYKRFIATTPKQMKAGGTRTTPLLSTHFDCYDKGGAYAAVSNNQFYKTGQALHFKTTDWAGVTQWTAWLRQQYDNGTPVIVVYPLSADETESVAGQTLTVSAGNNTAEIIQASIDDLELEVKYEKNA